MTELLTGVERESESRRSLGSLGLVFHPDNEPDVSKERERTRQDLAMLLVGLLAAEIALALVLLAINRLTVEEFKDVQAVVLTPIFGLVAAAVGFYFRDATGGRESAGTAEAD